MRQKSGKLKEPAEKVVRDIRRATRKQYSAEEKIRIVLSGLRGEDSIAELCRREGIAQSLYYSWSKEFQEAGKKRLAGDTAREATSTEVKGLRKEAVTLKEVVAELMLENRLLKKKHDRRWGRRGMRYPASESEPVNATGPRERANGDHPAGRAIASVGAPDAGAGRRAPGHVLPLVRPLPDRWA